MVAVADSSRSAGTAVVAGIKWTFGRAVWGCRMILKEQLWRAWIRYRFAGGKMTFRAWQAVMELRGEHKK